MSLAGKDQAVGALILAVCVVVAVAYVVALVKPDLVLAALPWLTCTEWDVRFWIVAVVVLIAFLAIMFIGAWIGWTMATTPPPKPIEELELEEEEEKPVEEAKAEEAEEKPETEAETKPKRRGRKRKKES